MHPRKIARVTGWLFIVTFVVGIPPAFMLYTSMLGHPNYIVGAGADDRIALGAFLEMILIVANIGTAVVLFPILKRQNESLALGYVTARVMECVFIAVGILSLLAVVTLRQDVGAAGGDSLVIGRQVARRDPRLDVPARARLGRRRRERADPGLPDVPVRPRAAGHGDAGADRRSADHPVGDRSCCSTSSSQAPGRRSSRRSRSSSGSCRSASTSSSRGSRPLHHSWRGPTPLRSSRVLLPWLSLSADPLLDPAQLGARHRPGSDVC